MNSNTLWKQYFLNQKHAQFFDIYQFDIQLHGLNTVSQLQINVYLNPSPMLCTALRNSWTSVFLIHERRKLMWNTPYLFLASIPLIKPEFWVIMFSQCIATGSERSVSLHIHNPIQHDFQQPPFLKYSERSTQESLGKLEFVRYNC